MFKLTHPEKITFKKPSLIRVKGLHKVSSYDEWNICVSMELKCSFIDNIYIICFILKEMDQSFISQLLCF